MSENNPLYKNQTTVMKHELLLFIQLKKVLPSLGRQLVQGQVIKLHNLILLKANTVKKNQEQAHYTSGEEITQFFSQLLNGG